MDLALINYEQYLYFDHHRSYMHIDRRDGRCYTQMGFLLRIAPGHKVDPIGEMRHGDSGRYRNAVGR